MSQRTLLALLAALSCPACSLSHDVVRLGTIGSDGGEDAAVDSFMPTDAPDDVRTFPDAAVDSVLPTWSMIVAMDGPVTRVEGTTIYTAYRYTEGAVLDATRVAAAVATAETITPLGITQLLPEQDALGTPAAIDPIGPAESSGAHLVLTSPWDGTRLRLHPVRVSGLGVPDDIVRFNEPGPTYTAAPVPNLFAVSATAGDVFGVVQTSTSPADSVSFYERPITVDGIPDDIDMVFPIRMTQRENVLVEDAFIVRTEGTPCVLTRNAVSLPEGGLLTEYGVATLFPSNVTTQTFDVPNGCLVDIAERSIRVDDTEALVSVWTCRDDRSRFTSAQLVRMERNEDGPRPVQLDAFGVNDLGRRMLFPLQVASGDGALTVAAVYAEPLDDTHDRVVAELTEYGFDGYDVPVRASRSLRVVLVESSSTDGERVATFDLHASDDMVVLETLHTGVSAPGPTLQYRAWLRR